MMTYYILQVCCNHNDVNCYRYDHIVTNDVTCVAGLLKL